METDLNFVDDFKLFEENVEEFAIVGMDVNIGNLQGLEKFWKELIEEGQLAIEFPSIRKTDIEEFIHDDKKLSKAVYFEGISDFDYAFFNLTKRDAQLMDPNQRKMLETASRTIEDAGLTQKAFSNSNTGVFIGVHSNIVSQYSDLIRERERAAIDLSVTGNTGGMIASRLSYYFNLNGPSMLIDTTCSSSLVALHTAINAIKNNDCDMALVGATHIEVLPLKRANIGVSTNDGITKTFDERSTGTSSGEGNACLLIKRLDSALIDGNYIYAIIKGSAINQDGRSIGITAPQKAAQSNVLKKAWQSAKISAEQLNYIEAHGTGTQLGDPIEWEGLDEAMKCETDKRQFCGVGSVKTNIGHTDSVAGLAGIIKMVLALKNKQVPASLNFQLPNKKIDFINSALYVSSKTKKWESKNGARICGVSSFGITGTNAHVVLSELVESPNYYLPEVVEEELKVLVFSAKDQEGLYRRIADFYDYFEAIEFSSNSIDDICYSHLFFKEHYAFRVGIMFREVSELIYYLKEILVKYSQYKNERVHFSGNIRSTESIPRASSFFQDMNFEESNLCSALEAFCNGDSKELYDTYSNRKHLKYIPTMNYKFKAQRVWVEPDRQPFFLEKWQPDKRDVLIEANFNKRYLVLHDNQKIIQEIVLNLEKEGIEVVAKISKSGALELNGTDLNGFDNIIYANFYDEENSSVNPQKILRDLKQIHKICHDSLFTQKKEIIILVNLVKDLGHLQQEIHAENSILIGMSKVLSEETPNVNFSTIQLAKKSKCSRNLINWLKMEKNEHVIYHCERIYVGTIEQIKNLKVPQSDYLKRNGIYIITGGLGEIGVELAKHLANKMPIHLIILGLSEITTSSEECVLFLNKERKGQLFGELYREVVSKGSTIQYFNCDVSNYNELAAIIEKINIEHGAVNGVFHLAGKKSNGFLMNQSAADLEINMRAKVQGTIFLDELTENEAMDFFVLFSSVNVLKGVAGQSDYTAANCFLDAYVQEKKSSKFKVINWGPWAIGLAVNFNNFGSHKKLKMLHPQVALEYMDTFMASNYDQIIIMDIEESHSDFNEYQYHNEETEEAPKGNDKEAIVDQIKQVWTELLGDSFIDHNINFFEAGGDSLKLGIMHEKIDKLYPGYVALSDLFSYSTINSISQFLVKQFKPEMNDTAEIAKLLFEGKMDTDKALDFLMGGEEESE